MNLKKAKKVLVCPLDWGLGHAARDVRIIRELVCEGFEVLIGADNAPLFFLKEQFPDLPFVTISSIKISYPSNGSMVYLMLLSIPKIIYGIILEHFQLKKITEEYGIDIVISDNRYGLRNKKVHSVFVGHQLFIKTPFRFRVFDYLLNRLNHWLISGFNECWVPDLPGELNFSGTLSHNKNLPRNVYFVGPLSRFQNSENENSIQSEVNYDILIILSGPEPQRSIFEKILVSQISATEYKALIVQGKLLDENNSALDNIKFVNHLESSKLKSLIIKTPVIISRSGYSTIMDLMILCKTAILVPTPGQTEQMYLAGLLKEKKWFYTVSQKDFDIKEAIGFLNQYSPAKVEDGNKLLEERIKSVSMI